MDKSTEFGNRYLNQTDDAFQHNAWDQVEMDEQMEKDAFELIANQKQNAASAEKVIKLDTNPNQFWNRFYSNNANRFFKDRHWLSREFSELFDSGTRFICEIGCGAGNTVFPYLKESEDENAFAYCFDYSSEAVKVVQQNPLYDEKRCKAFVYGILKID
jgi:tRNAThr (cytosine32-N3)-methyltransferase